LHCAHEIGDLGERLLEIDPQELRGHDPAEGVEL
jgi:hypothetical protein